MTPRDVLTVVVWCGVALWSQALEVIPYTLAENAGLHPISIVTGVASACFLVVCAVLLLLCRARLDVDVGPPVCRQVEGDVTVAGRVGWCRAELRKRHAEGGAHFGINIRHSTISDLREENVVQPLLVSTSAIALATETVCMILKIDDMVPVR